MNKKALIAAGLLATGYGVGVGLQAKVRQPRNTQEARQSGSLGSLGTNIAKDIGISIADDAVAFAALPFLKKRFNKMGGIFDTVMAGAGIIGAGVGGAIGGHDFQNYVAARQYQSRNQDLSFSQTLIPDIRTNPIQGFRNQGLSAMQRRQQTGIGSPTAGGLFYNMWHNPFADMLNQSIANPGDPKRAEDPRSKALGFSYAGGLLGSALGIRGGIARMTGMGITGGIMGGAYGMYSAHNPDLGANLGALWDIAAGTGPVLGVGAAIFATTKIPKLGNVITKGLNKSVQGFGWTANKLDKFNPRLDEATIQTNRFVTKITSNTIGSEAVHGGIDNVAWGIDKFNSSILRSGPIPTRLEWNASAAIDKIATSTGSALSAPLQSTHFISKELITPMLANSGKQTGVWNQSLALSHIATVIPHQVLVGGMAVSMLQQGNSNTSNSNKRHATNTMPSNSAR